MFVIQKSQEISLALIKLAIYVRRLEFRQRLESLALQLLESASSRNFEETLSIVDVLQSMVSFGKTIYEIEPVNAKVMLGELENLNAAIRQSAGLLGENESIAELFSKLPQIAELPDNAANHANGNGNGQINGGNGNGINATIRQSAIIEKIRQSGNVAIKDLIAAFPEVSERTLRYDLQRLCTQGVIDRVGNGGPSSYYTLRNKIAESSL